MLHRRILILVAVVFVAVVVAVEGRLYRIDKQIQESRTMSEQFMPAGYIRIERDGNVWVIPRLPGESIEAWITRAVLYRKEGIPLSSLCCETFVCNGDTVQLCLPCMVGEDKRACRARVLDAVEAYKKAAGC